MLQLIVPDVKRVGHCFGLGWLGKAREQVAAPLAPTGVVRLVVEVVSRDIVQRDPERQWFTTYHARVLEVWLVRAP